MLNVMIIQSQSCHLGSPAISVLRMLRNVIHSKRFSSFAFSSPTGIGKVERACFIGLSPGSASQTSQDKTFRVIDFAMQPPLSVFLCFPCTNGASFPCAEVHISLLRRARTFPHRAAYPSENSLSKERSSLAVQFQLNVPEN